MNIMNGLKGYSAQELIDISFPPREAVLEPWLRTEETAVIWSASGVGKTWMSLGIALAVAGGGSVGDWTAPKARTVLYLDGEMHQGDLQDRIKFLIETGAVKVPNRELALVNLRIVARQAQDAGKDFLDLTDKDHQESLLRAARGKAEVVILDNLTTMSEGLDDENDSTEFKSLQGLFMEMKRAGIVGILVHHANKGGSQMRGSTALETTFEVILGLHRVSLAAPGRATFRTDFGKFRAKGDNRLEQRVWSLGEHGWDITDAEPEDLREDPVLKALMSLECVSQTEIATKLGLNKATVSKRLVKLKAAEALGEGEAQEWFKKARDYRDGVGIEEEEEGLGEDPGDARAYAF
jgi:putative DNA primase/helicase